MLCYQLYLSYLAQRNVIHCKVLWCTICMQHGWGFSLFHAIIAIWENRQVKLGISGEKYSIWVKTCNVMKATLVWHNADIYEHGMNYICIIYKFSKTTTLILILSSDYISWVSNNVTQANISQRCIISLWNLLGILKTFGWSSEFWKTFSTFNIKNSSIGHFKRGRFKKQYGASSNPTCSSASSICLVLPFVY